MYVFCTYKNNQHHKMHELCFSQETHETSSMQEHPLKTANVKTHERRNITDLKPGFMHEPSTFILYFASHTTPFLSGMKNDHAISQQELYCGEIDDL